eukprot:218062_1
MSYNISQTVTQLLSNLRYPERNAVLRAVEDVLQQLPSVRPKASTYVSDTGVQSTLLQLSGTIPIQFRGNQYHIPITIWITEAFPTHPPLCYVTPTANMSIKPRHKHVDAQGMVYLSYLHQWNRNTSDLINLVAVMSSTFGQDPPVFSRAAGSSYQQPVRQPQPQQQPSYPAAGRGQFPYQQPQYPAANAYASPARTFQPQPVAQSAYGGGQPRLTPAQLAAQQAEKAKQEAAKRKLEQEKAARLSKETEERRLRDEITRTLQGKLRTRADSLTNELSGLFDTTLKLKESAASLKTQIEELRTEKERLQRRSEELDSKTGSLSKWLEEQESVDEIDVNTVVRAADTWSEQLLGQVSQDQAIEDTLHALDVSFSDEQIPLPTYIKQIRKMAREQFFIRALTRKIIEKQKVRVSAHSMAASH